MSLLNTELNYAKDNCGFVPLENDNDIKTQIREYAKLCFAVICKSKMLIEEYKTYEEAVDDVNNGESAFEAPQYLGLENLTRDVRYKDTSDFGGIVAHSVHHTVYVSMGYFDDYGTPNKLDSIKDWFRFSRRLYRFIK